MPVGPLSLFIGASAPLLKDFLRRWVDAGHLDQEVTRRVAVMSLMGHAIGTVDLMRIFFTGGSGKAGRHAVEYLVACGHQVTNIDLVAAGLHGVPDLRVDLTDAGQVFNALSAYARYGELESGTGVPRYDAVVHFAAVPAILIRPDNETFRVNALSTYNVLDAAVKLGVSKVIFASSETTYGVCFADGEVRPEYVPVDEAHPTVPEDSYAMSKVVNEATARSFQARSGIDVYGLRINNVIEPHEYETKFPAFVADPALRRRNIFAYIDARDLGHMVDCCLRTDGLGYEVFNVANDDTSVAITSAEVYDRFYAGVPKRGELADYQSFYSNDKAKRLVGFAPRHSWRDATDAPNSDGPDVSGVAPSGS